VGSMERVGMEVGRWGSSGRSLSQPPTTKPHSLSR
jgi:hypothetical protein